MNEHKRITNFHWKSNPQLCTINDEGDFSRKATMVAERRWSNAFISLYNSSTELVASSIWKELENNFPCLTPFISVSSPSPRLAMGTSRPRSGPPSCSWSFSFVLPWWCSHCRWAQGIWSCLCGFILQMINDVLQLLSQFHQQFSTRQQNVQIELKWSMDGYCLSYFFFSTIYSYQIFWCVYCSSRENWIGNRILLLFFCKLHFWNFLFLFFPILLSLSQHHGLSVILVWRTSIPLDGEPEVRREL